MKVIYLVQGALSDLILVKDFLPKNQYLMTLNYDQDPTNFDLDLSRHVYFPRSTWAEGRNLLLQKAQALQIDFDYFVFMDADLRVIKGNFAYFEEMLSIYRPKLGLPLGDQVKNSFRYEPSASVQTQFSFDQILQAYRSDVVADSICIPYSTDFDSDSWWYSCEINSYLSVIHYGDEILQFNEFEIENSRHDGPQLNAEGQSGYRGGIDFQGLQRCRALIKSRNEPWRYIVGTLFHPRFLPKLIYYPTLRQLLQKEFEGALPKSFRHVLKSFIKSLQHQTFRTMFQRFSLENRIILKSAPKMDKP